MTSGSIVLQLEGLQAAAEQIAPRLSALEDQVKELVKRGEDTGGAIGAVAQTRGVITNALGAAENTLLGRIAGVEAQLGHIANEINAINNAILLQGNKLAEMQQTSSAQLKRPVGLRPLHEQLAAIENAQAARHGAMANEVNAMLNLVRPQVQAQHALLTRIENLARMAADNRDMDMGLDVLASRSTSALLTRAHTKIAANFPPVAKPRRAPDLAAQMAEMNSKAPANFPKWHALYEAGVAEGLRTSEGNLSHEGHIGAGYFRMFVNVHARGRLLDVGCGPIAVPSYLGDYPLDLVAGIDPQQPFEPHPFPFAQTFAETIPWPDASFETVVIATSLDHVFLLDATLAEIRRVLTPGGRLLLWTGMFAETAPYDPTGGKISPPDAYHLFHPGRNWFYKTFERDFSLIERLKTVANSELLAYASKS